MKKYSAIETILLVLATILMVVGLFNSILTVFRVGLNIITALQVIVYLLITLYELFLYKIPHGDFLKVLLLIFALYVGCISICVGYSTLSAILIVASAILIGFVSGRLNRYKQNTIFAVVIAILLLVASILESTSFSKIQVPVDTSKESYTVEATVGVAPGQEVSMDKKTAIVPVSLGNDLLDSINVIISISSLFMMWIVIFLGYLARYREHKEADMLD